MTSHKHHRKRRSQQGDDSPENIIELDFTVHELVHRHPEKAYEYGLLVHSYDDPASIKPDVPGFLAALASVGVHVPDEHEHTGKCEMCGVELTQKPKRPRLKDEDLAKRKTVSVRLPEGVDGLYWKQLLEDAESVELSQPDTQFSEKVGAITTGKLLVAVLERFTGRA